MELIFLGVVFGVFAGAGFVRRATRSSRRINLELRKSLQATLAENARLSLNDSRPKGN